MGIDLHWISEDGETRQMVSDESRHLVRILKEGIRSDSICLRFIDHFGDTVFNQAQIPYLEKELSEISPAKLPADTRAHLEKILLLISHARGRTHTYLKFYGD